MALLPWRDLSGKFLTVFVLLPCAFAQCNELMTSCEHDNFNDGSEPAIELLQRNVKLMLADTSKAEIMYGKTTTINISASEVAAATGITANGVGDLTSFVSSAICYFIAFWVMIYIFMYLRKRYPKMFMRNILIDKIYSEGTIPDDKWGWKEATDNFKVETLTDAEKMGLDSPMVVHFGQMASVADKVGLDHAMLLQLSQMAMTMMSHLGFPLVCVLGLLHLFCGGHAAGKDHMSYLSMGNVENGSWLYWVHAFVVWFVVVTVKHIIFQYHVVFQRLRFRWLRTLPEPRCTTIMVEGIPPEQQSDNLLKEFFAKMFGADKIKSAYVVKNTYALTKMMAQKEARELELMHVNAQWEQVGKDPSKRPTDRHGDKITNLEVQIKADAEEIVKLRADILKRAQTPGSLWNSETGLYGVNSHTGFVTFHKRSDTEMALSVQYKGDAEIMAVSTPPQPSAILWSDLYLDETSSGAYTALGFGLVTALYIGYLPLVIGITNIATAIKLGPLQPLWAGFAPTMGLQFMVAFLPTFLILIFRLCFILKDDAYAQLKLEKWYFIFNLVFVILVTSIGTNIIEFMKTAATNPFGLIIVFAKTMPHATHYYMNFMVLQPVTHSMNLTRYINIMKFEGFSRLYDDENEAANASEPEDQDYYGMGSRVARHVTLLLIGIIFCVLCPPMTVLTWLNFRVSRLVYGYLVNFAEIKKSDLGGAFYDAAVRQIFIGLFFFVLLMAGVLYGRADTSGPCVIAALSLFYVWSAFNTFNVHFSWEKLPFEEVVGYGSKNNTSDEVYYQTELKA